MAPPYELLASFQVLRDRDRQAPHLPWVRAAGRALDGVDLVLLDAIIPAATPRGVYIPDFLAPPPQALLPDFAGERARDAARTARRELRACFAGRSMPAAAPADHLRRVADGGGDELSNLATVQIECDRVRLKKAYADAPMVRYDLDEHEEDLTMLLRAWPYIEEAVLREADQDEAEGSPLGLRGLADSLRLAFRVEVQPNNNLM